MALPDSHFLEVEFTAGVWTDVTAYTDGVLGAQTQYGRTTQYGAPQAASLGITLDNTDGRFTPLRQTLKDGVTPHPYWPNVLPRKRIRWGYVKAAVRYIRFTGYITGWPPGLLNGFYEQVAISATDRSLQLQRFKMRAPILQEMDFWNTVYAPGALGFSYYWPLTDAVGSNQAAANYGPVALSGPTPPTFGDAGGVGPGTGGTGNGTAAVFDGTSKSLGAVVNVADFSAFVWVRPVIPPGGPATMTVLGIDDGNSLLDLELRLNSSMQPEFRHNGGTVTSGTAIPTGQWSLIGVTYAAPNVTLWVNGVSAATGAGAASLGGWNNGAMRIGREATTQNRYYAGSLGHVYYAVGFTSTAAQDVGRYYVAGRVGQGETVDARIARFLRYALLGASSYNLDASTVALDTYEQSDKAPFDAGQELVDSEGGGSALYVDTDDRVRFVTRARLAPGAPALTIDAIVDLDRSTWDPAYDADTLVNSSVGTQSNQAGSVQTLSAIDDPSASTYGPQSGDFTSYALSGADVLANAQSRVAAGRTPGFRLNRIVVNLTTAQNNLWAAAAAVRIGDRIRLTNLPAGAAPTTQLDVIVQGWADSYSLDAGYSIAFDTVPADMPAWFILSDATYGRWGCSGSALNADITAGATTMVVASSGGATFTTDGTMYPLTVQIGAEQITLTTAPGGSTSPQTFTGLTRGVNGTTAAAQPGGSTVDLAPASTWTL